MAVEGGEKGVEGCEKQEACMLPVGKSKPRELVVVSLRLLALCATVSATVVMALNKETESRVVAIIGNTPIYARLTAKFQNTPAFVFFVIANSIASFHNLLLLLVSLFGKKLDFKCLNLLITLADMVMVALVSAGAAASTSMAELGKHGNSHARWSKICDKFSTYCDHGGGALIASFGAVALLMVLNALSTIALYKNQAKCH